MKIVLVGAELEENLSIRYLASYLRSKGHRVRIVAFASTQDAAAAAVSVVREAPDLVGLSMVFQMRAIEFMELADALREAGYDGHITCGGHFPTFAYREVLDHCAAIDSVVRHEGEFAMAALAAALESGGDLAGVAGLVLRDVSQDSIVQNPPRKPIEDLDSLPFPARDTFPHRHLGAPYAPIVGSRGCYGNCSFCCINAWHKAAGGRKYRLRSPQNVVSEMAELYHRRGVRVFVFHDDNFFLPRKADNLKRIGEFGALLRKEGVDAKLVVKARPNDVDREVFGLLKEIGLVRAYLGIENASPSGLLHLNRNVDLAQNERAIETLHDLEIFACYNILLFDPYTTAEDIAHNIRFMRNYNYFPHNFCRTEIYVGSPLQYRLEKEGRLLGNPFAYSYVIADSLMEALFQLFAAAFYERNFGPASIANASMGLSYRVHLLGALFPDADTAALRADMDRFVRDVNDRGLDALQDALDFVLATGLDEAAHEEFAAELAARIDRETDDQWLVATDLDARIDRAHLAAKRFASPRVLTTATSGY